MDRSKELKVLQQVLTLVDEPDAGLRRMGRYVLAGKITGWLGLFAAGLLLHRGVAPPLACVVVAAGSGMIAGFAIYYAMVIEQWPVLKDHLDTESVQRRIEQLEA